LASAEPGTTLPANAVLFSYYKDFDKKRWILMEVIQQDVCKIQVAILTASDRSARGEREDLSGKVIEEVAKSNGWEVAYYGIVPDEKETIKAELVKIVDKLKADLILTTGGTGLAPRDFTPEATLEIIHKEVPGIAEAMRMESLKKTPHAMLSRAVCGVRGKALIVNLPGSPRAVRECLEVIIPVIPHALELMQGEVSDCGTTPR
jgi:molybdenum cofactor synthesis domain-containing protein